MSAQFTPVLEIGGTHVTAALVSDADWTVVPGSTIRVELEADGSADDLLTDIARAANTLTGGHHNEWAVAVPGPFDLDNGIGLYENVGKFESLNGVDFRAELTARISPTPASVHFLNDADAYGVGEYAIGAARGFDRAICITLGTGVGSGYLVGGEPVEDGPGVAPEGEAHLLNFAGLPLEDTVSRRAIRSAYATAVAFSGEADAAADVREIADLARSGDAVAAGVLNTAWEALGYALADGIREFGAGVLVIGGSMSASWDLVEPAVRRGLASVVAELADLPICRAQHPDDAPVIGAAFWAARHRS